MEKFSKEFYINQVKDIGKKIHDTAEDIVCAAYDNGASNVRLSAGIEPMSFAELEYTIHFNVLPKQKAVEE